MANDDSKTPAEIAAVAFPDGARDFSAKEGPAYLALRAAICSALAAGELEPAAPAVRFDQLSAADRVRTYSGEQPIFNPRVAEFEHVYRDPRTKAIIMLSQGDLYSDFDSVRIERATFHAWLDRSGRSRMAPLYDIAWPVPAGQRTKSIVERVAALAGQRGENGRLLGVRGACRRLEAETGKPAETIRAEYNKQQGVAREEGASRKHAEGELRLRVVKS